MVAYPRGADQLIYGLGPGNIPVPITVDADGNLQVEVTAIAVSGPISGTFTDHSGAITTGGTAQTVMAANANRKYLLVQNVSDINMWIDFGVAAVADQPSIELLPFGVYWMDGAFVSTQSVSIIGATTGKKFVAKEG